MLSNPAAREGAWDIGPQANLLIPGLNPLLPWTYGWIALVVTIVIHEVGHGIVARVYDAKMESTGLLSGIDISDWCVRKHSERRVRKKTLSNRNH